VTLYRLIFVLGLFLWLRLFVALTFDNFLNDPLIFVLALIVFDDFFGHFGRDNFGHLRSDRDDFLLYFVRLFLHIGADAFAYTICGIVRIFGGFLRLVDRVFVLFDFFVVFRVASLESVKPGAVLT